MMLYKVVVKRIDKHLECQNNLFYDISLQIYYIWGFFLMIFFGGGGVMAKFCTTPRMNSIIYFL